MKVTDQERIEAIEKQSIGVSMKDAKWLVETVKKYMHACNQISRMPCDASGSGPAYAYYHVVRNIVEVALDSTVEG